MPDAFLITTIITSGAAVCGWVKVSSLDGKLNDLAHRYTFQRERGDRYRDQMLDLQTKLCAHEQAEATRQAQRIAASKKAAETAAARAQARREAEAIERPLRAAKTMEAFAATKLRSRDVVVAPVKAARTRAQNNSGAGVAATAG